MDKLEQVFEQLDQVATTQPKVVQVCKQYGLRPGHVLGGAGGLVLLITILTQGYTIICALLTCVYPMWMSIAAIESESDETKGIWLSFWCVFGLFQTAEQFLGFILNFIPYYAYIRLFFFVYLMNPFTEGAKNIYQKAFRPYLKAHQKEIEEVIAKVSSQASQVGAEAMSQARSKAKELSSAENMAKAAALA